MYKRPVIITTVMMLAAPSIILAQSDIYLFKSKQMEKRRPSSVSQREEGVKPRQELPDDTTRESGAVDENETFLMSRLADNKDMSESQKRDIINFMRNQYKATESFKDEKYNDAVSYFERVANDSNMTRIQKKEALRTYLAGQKEKAPDAEKSQENNDSAEFKYGSSGRS